MIVVDANVMVMALVSPTGQGDTARAAMLADDDWIAPAHMPLEVLRTLSKAVVGKRIAAVDAEAAFGALRAMQIVYAHIDIPLLQAVWALRHNVSIYDATYFAVAALNDASVITFDARLAEATAYTKLDIVVKVLAAEQV